MRSLTLLECQWIGIYSPICWYQEICNFNCLIIWAFPSMVLLIQIEVFHAFIYASGGWDLKDVIVDWSENTRANVLLKGFSYQASEIIV